MARISYLDMLTWTALRHTKYTRVLVFWIFWSNMSETVQRPKIRDKTGPVIVEYSDQEHLQRQNIIM